MRMLRLLAPDAVIAHNCCELLTDLGYPFPTRSQGFVGLAKSQCRQHVRPVHRYTRVCVWFRFVFPDRYSPNPEQLEYFMLPATRHYIMTMTT